jgi:hypothetical protein
VKDTPQIAAARIEAERSRALLIATAQDLQERLSPKTLTRDAIEGVKHKGADLVEDAVDAVRARPVASTGVVAAIALFLAREPLMDLAGKLVGGASARKPRKKTKKSAQPKDKHSNSETVG